MSAKVIQMQPMPKRVYLVCGNELKRENNRYDPNDYSEDRKPIKTTYENLYTTDGSHIYYTIGTTPYKEKNNGQDRYVLLEATNHKTGRNVWQWYRKVDLLVNTYYGKIPEGKIMIYKDGKRKNAMIANIEFVDKTTIIKAANKNNKTGTKGICEINKKTAKGTEIRYRVKHEGKEKNFKTLAEAQAYLLEVKGDQEESESSESASMVSDDTPKVLKQTQEEIDADYEDRDSESTEEEPCVYTKKTRNQIVTKINEERLELMEEKGMDLKEFLTTFGLTPYDPAEKGNRDPKIVKLLALEAKYDMEAEKNDIINL